MNGLKRWLRAISPRTQRADAEAVSTLRATTKALRSELRTMGETVRGLSGQLDAVRVQLDQLGALREEEARQSGRASTLARMLDADRIRTHLRDAVARAVIADQAAHAIVSDVLPHDVYAALLDAVPAPIFFAGGAASGQEMPVPPRIAPADTIATWSVLAELMRDAFMPALMQRLDPGPGGAFTMELGRLICREPGGVPIPARHEARHLFTVVIHLAAADDGPEYGSRLGAIEIPFSPNTAIVVRGSTPHEYRTIPADAGVTRCSYEFRIAPATASGNLPIEP